MDTARLFSTKDIGRYDQQDGHVERDTLSEAEISLSSEKDEHDILSKPCWLDPNAQPSQETDSLRKKIMEEM